MTQAKVSWVEFDTAAVPVHAKVSWVEFDTAASPVHAKVSWVEFDTAGTPTIVNEPPRYYSTGEVERHVRRLREEDEVVLAVLQVLVSEM